MYDIDSTLLFPYRKKLRHDSSLRGKYKTDWVEENVFNPDATSHPEYSGASHVGIAFSQKRSWYVISALLLVFVVIIGRLFFLQALNGAAYRSLAENNRQRIIPIPSERGLLFDRSGIQLVENIPNFALAIIPQDLPREEAELNELVTQLAQLTKQSTDEVYNIITTFKDYRFESVVVKEDIDYETALSIYVATADLPGVHIQQGSKRLYFNGTASSTASASSTLPIVTESTISFSHIIGYLGKLSEEELGTLYEQGYIPSDVIGKTGIEKQYESVLRGSYGHRRIEVDASGKQQSILAEETPLAGSNLTLTIDARVQHELERVLVKHLALADKQRASAIALDPRNGEVLALVSLPVYDNNDFSGGISREAYQSYLDNEHKPLFNRAIAGRYPSGSTIKPAVALAALAEEIITPQSSFLSTGGIRVGPWFFPDWQAGGHGRTNVRRSLAWSVNTFYYYIGGGFGDFAGLGLEKLVAYLEGFKFNERLGIDIPGEAAGFIPTRSWKKAELNEPWYIGDTYNLSIGQGHLLVTPLQIAGLTSFVANRGEWYVPHVVKKITNPVTQTSEAVEPQKLSVDERISHADVETVAAGMRDCVDYGSCRYLSSLPVAIAGKTGTAQWSAERPDHAWFTSFAPFTEPEIVLTIMVEEGEGGSSIGVPIAYDFYNWWWQYRGEE